LPVTSIRYIRPMITGIVSSRIRVVAGSTLSMMATDLASAKLSTMLANAQIASIHATKAVGSKGAARAAALWMLIMSFIIPVHTPPVAVSHPVVHHHKKMVKPAPDLTPISEPVHYNNQIYLHTFEKQYTAVFSGKVTCGEGLCKAAEVQIHVV